jgi:hypothetical protein
MNRYPVVLLLTPFLLFAAMPALAQALKIALEGSDYNFGRVYQGQKVEHVFHFRNTGDAPLDILKVRSSCGCTAALVSSTQIGPGEAGEVRATFDSTRFRGEVVKTVYLYSNDPVRQVTQFTIRGQVKAEIVPDPPQLDFGLLKAGEEKVLSLKLSNQGEEEVAFPGVETTTPELKAALSDSKLDPGKTSELVVRAMPRDGKGRLSGFILVKTSSPRIPELRIPVFGRYEEIPVPR